ncbi:MAG TPA: glycosyltransferase family 2 protein [Vicinamibacteria bacterium]|nr:glycosyltransferase family 2 protein [Vicinamibacteria bacterium]
MRRPPRVGVVVLDHGRPDDAARAVASAREPGLDVHLLIVDNPTATAEVRFHGGASADRVERVCPRENLGFGGGMNLGIERLSRRDCDCFLLLNNDAVLEPGCLRLLTEALSDRRVAATGPVILREADRRVESRGLSVDLRWGRVRLAGHGEPPPHDERLMRCDALSGAVLLVGRVALERVGLLDADYFFGFEDVDWCLRARRAGLEVAAVHGAHAVHEGGLTLGRSSPARLYYAARNHLRCVERHLPLRGPARLLRRAAVLGLNLSFALRQDEVPRMAAAGAVAHGIRDACRCRFGSRASA